MICTDKQQKDFEEWYQKTKRQTMARSDRSWALLGYNKGRETGVLHMPPESLEAAQLRREAIETLRRGYYKMKEFYVLEMAEDTIPMMDLLQQFLLENG